jgi:ATP-dependent DNA helicase RecG
VYGFRTIIRRVRGRGTGEPGEKTREETGEKTREKILALIAANPTISTNELAEEIGITPKGTEWQLRPLKQAGRLKRVGPRKGGRREVIGNGNG